MQPRSSNPSTPKPRYDATLETNKNVNVKKDSHTPTNQSPPNTTNLQLKAGQSFRLSSSHNFSGATVEHNENIRSSSSSSDKPIVTMPNNGSPSTPANANNAKFDIIFQLVRDGHITPDKFNTDTESLLGIACSTGQFNLARLLLQKGADVNHLGANGEHTPLMEAVNNNSLKIAKLLINSNANVNAKSKSGYTALHIACASGSLECTKLLIEAGADPTICSALLRTPVMEAAFCGHAAIIAYLLDECPKTINSTECLTNSNSNNICGQIAIQHPYYSSSSSASAPNSNLAGCNNENYFKMCHINFRESPLLIASHRGHADAVRVILERMPYMLNPEEDIMSSILEATIDCHMHVVELLLDFASKNFEIDEALNSPLTLAASGGHLGLVKLFIEYGANPDDFNAEGFTPLMEACREGHLEVIKYFLSSEVGAKINTITKEHGETALSISCCSGNLEAVKYLVEVGHASIELGHSPPLLEASSENHPDIVEYLIVKGASVNAKGSVGRDALYQACEAGNIDVVRVLLKYGANIESFADDNKSPLMRAVENGHIDVVEYLLSKGAQVNATSPDGNWTPVLIACLSGNVIMARYLIANGADPRIKVGDNSNILIETVRAGQLNMIAFLLNPSINTPYLEDRCDHHKSHLTMPLANTVPVCSAAISQRNVINKAPSVYWPSDVSETERLKSLIPPRILDIYMKTNKITDRNEACDSMAAAFQAYSRKIFDSHQLCANIHSSSAVVAADDASTQNHHHPRSDKLFNSTCDANQSNNTIKRPTRMCEYHNLVELMSQLDWNNLPSELLALGNCIAMKDFTGDDGFTAPAHASGGNTVAPNSNAPAAVTTTTTNDTAPTDDVDQKSRSLTLLDLLEHLSLKGSKFVSPGIAHNNDKFNVCVHNALNHSVAAGNCCANTNQTINGSDAAEEFCCLASYASKYLQLNDVGSPISEDCIRNVIVKITNYFKGSSQPISDINQRTDSSRDSPLSVATNMGFMDVVDYLVKNNANVNILDRRGYSPLMVACSIGHYHLVRYFLKIPKVDVNIQSERTHESALTLAAASGRFDVVEKLLERGANIEHKNSNDYTALCLAAHGGYIDLVQLLLIRKANVNCRTTYSPLILAVMNGHLNVAELLIKYGADVNVCVESNGNSALSIAVFSNKADLADLLLKNGAVPDIKNKGSFTPFMDAVSSNNVAIGRILLDYNCDTAVTSSLSCRESAMLMTAEKGNNEFMEMLLQRKFPVDCRNKKGQTPSWISATNGFLNCLILLYEYKANIELPDYGGVTPLLSAFKNCHIEVVEWLVSKVDQLPSLGVCRKHISKCTPVLKSKYEHSYEILNSAISRKSQIAEMNANRLLLEEERVKNKKKKKRKAKKPAKPAGKEAEAAFVHAGSPAKSPTKPTQASSASKNDKTTDDDDDSKSLQDNSTKSGALEVDYTKSINESSSQQLSDVSSCVDSDSEGWFSNQHAPPPSQRHPVAAAPLAASSSSTNVPSSVSTHNQPQHSVSVSSVKKSSKPSRGPNVDMSESITEVIYISRSSVSRTIGRNGSTISAIKSKTSTFIDIDTVTEFDSGRLCKTVVVGKKEGVDQAIRILRSVESNSPSVMDELGPFLGEYAQLNFSNSTAAATNRSTTSNESTSVTTHHHRRPTQISVTTSATRCSPSSFKRPPENVSVSTTHSVSTLHSNVKVVSAASSTSSQANATVTNEKPKNVKSSGSAKEIHATSKPVASPTTTPSPTSVQKPQQPTIIKTTTSTFAKDNHPRSRKQLSTEKTTPSTDSAHAPKIKPKSPTEVSTTSPSVSSKVSSEVVDLSWFPLLKSSDHSSSRKSTDKKGDTKYMPPQNYADVLNEVKKNSFPKSLNESTYIGFPSNEIAFATLNPNRQNLKLIPGRGRNAAPVSRLISSDLSDGQSILQHAHCHYPSYVSSLDQETLLRVTNTLAKEISSISNETIHDISSLKHAQNSNDQNSQNGAPSASQLLESCRDNFNLSSIVDPGSSGGITALSTAVSQQSQVMATLAATTTTNNKLPIPFSYANLLPYSSTAPHLIGDLVAGANIQSIGSNNTTPNSGPNQNFENGNTKTITIQVPVPVAVPVAVSSLSMLPHSLGPPAGSTSPFANLPPIATGFPSNVIAPTNQSYLARFGPRSVNFPGDQNRHHNYSSSYNYVNDAMAYTISTADLSNINNYYYSNPPSGRTSIFSFLERYGLLDLFEFLRHSTPSVEDLVPLSDNQLLELNIPVRFMQTLRMAINDYIRYNPLSTADLPTNLARNSRGYNFYHNEYNS